MFAILSLAVLAPAADPFTVKDGDRVVWLGSTIAEREQRYGYWETALHAAFPRANFTVRNLGWSGDTVFGDARAGFDTQKEGFQRLVGLTLELKPTVIFVSYGTNESFAGDAGLPVFEKGLEKLLDALAPAKARGVLFTPLPFQSDPFAHRWNPGVKKYADVVRAVAVRRKLAVADIGHQIDGRRQQTAAPLPPLTDNGMHLAEAGYEFTTEDFLAALGVRPGAGGPDDLARWRTRDTEPLRRAVQKKNELFFHRWRPQNETYLFGFRKHEQGKNAREVAEFDPLVDKAEKEIERIKKELFSK